VELTQTGQMLVALESRDNSHIFILPGGQAAQAREVTSAETPDIGVAPGPGGKLLVRSRGSDLYLMNADGSQRTLVRQNLRNYNSMSACGDRYLVFDSFEDNKLRLLRTDADGSNPVTLSEDAPSSNCSPDGRWLIFTSGDKLYRLPIEGGTPVEIFRSPNGLTGMISPDGKWVAASYAEAGPVPTPKMAVMPAEGGAPTHVFTRPFGSGNAHWSPDGKGLQFLLTRHGASNIWEQPLAGVQPHPVTDFTSGHIFGFMWSRDGKQLLLAKGEETSDVVLLSNFR